MDTDCRWRTRSLLALALSAMALLAAPAVAQQQRPCQEDIKKLCPKVVAGTREARRCLKDNFDRLSEPCRQRISVARASQAYPPRLKDCQADLEKFCKGIMAGGGRLVKCLREHESEISSDCKKTLPVGRGGGGAGRARTPTSETATAKPTVQRTVTIQEQ